MEDELDGSARERVSSDFATLVSGEAFLEIVCVTHIVGAVGTAEDVDAEAHAIHCRCSSFDRLRTSG